MLRLIGNILWFILGGVVTGLAWWLVGLLCYITIIGIPWGKSCFVIGQFAFWPFGREAISRAAFRGEADIGTGTLGTIGNVIWFVVAGIWLAIGHLTLAVSLILSIIGIPFGLQHIKLALLTLAPVGQTVVPIGQRPAQDALPVRN